jgi:hypothetical protein
MEAEKPAMYSESVVKYSPILIRVCNSLLAAEPRLFREHLYGSSTEIFVKINPEAGAIRILRAQTSPPLGSTGIYHGSSATSAHARAKAVGSFTFQYAWLKCALHDEDPDTFKGQRNLPCLSPNFKRTGHPR